MSPHSRVSPGLGTAWRPPRSSAWSCRASRWLSRRGMLRDVGTHWASPALLLDASTAALGVVRCFPVPLPLLVGSRPQSCLSGWLQGPKQSRYEGEGSPFSAWFAVGNPSPLSDSFPPRCAMGWVCSSVDPDTLQRKGRAALDCPGQESKSHLLSWGKVPSPCSKPSRAAPQPTLPAHPSGVGIQGEQRSRVALKIQSNPLGRLESIILPREPVSTCRLPKVLAIPAPLSG